MNLTVNVGSVVSARFATLQYHALIEFYREELRLIGNRQLMLSRVYSNPLTNIIEKGI